MVAAIVILAALAAGGIYLFSDNGASLRREIGSLLSTDAGTPEKKADSAARDGREAGVAHGGKAEASSPLSGIRKPADTASGPALPPTPADSAMLEGMYKSALASFELLEYDKTLRVLSDLLAGPVPADLRQRASKLDREARVFMSAVEGIIPLELSDFRNVVEIRLVNGNSVVGRILAETGAKVVVQEDYGIKAAFRREEIDRIDPIGADRLRKMKEAELDRFRKSPDVSRDDAISLYLLAEFCLRHGLREKVNDFLGKGFLKDSMFQELVYNEKCKRIYKQYLYYRGKKIEALAKKALDEMSARFPDSYFRKQAGKDEQEASVMAAPRKDPGSKPVPKPAPVPKPDPVPEPAPETGEEDPFGGGEDEPEAPAPKPPASGKGGLIDAARKLIADAKRSEEASFPGKPDADAHLAKAVAAYEKAAAALEKALESNPEHGEWIESQLEEIQSALYWCRKRTKVN